MKNKLMLAAGAVIIIILCGIAAAKWQSGKQDKEASIADVSFALGNGKTAVLVSCRKDSKEELYNLFLPSCARGKTLRLMPDGRQLSLEGVLYSEGEEITFPPEEGIYEAVLYNRQGEEAEKSRLRVMHSKNLPAVFIKTSSGNMEYVYSDKSKREAGYAQIFSEDGTMEGFEKLEYITGRGNTSWEAQKRAFGIKFKDAVEFLGMDAAKTWALLANYYDGSYIRNKIGMEIAEAGGIRYTPDSEFFDLYLNGEYAGLYQAMEKIEIGAGRIENREAVLLELDYPERAALEENYFLLPNRKPVVIHSPKHPKQETIEETGSFFRELIQTLETENYVNPETGKGIFEYIDKESWAKAFVMEEILQNMDFGVTSHYMYLLPEGGNNYKLYEGPLWDLDNTMGRGDKTEGELFASRCELESNNLGRWYARLYANQEFFEEVARQYEEYFKTPLAWYAQEGIRRQEAWIEASVRMDMVLFKGSRSIFMSDSSREEHIAYLENYLSAKADFLDRTWNASEETRQQWEQARTEPLPELLEEVWPEEAQEDGEEAQGLKTIVLNQHGYITAAVMAAAFCLVFVLDRRKNGK